MNDDALRAAVGHAIAHPQVCAVVAIVAVAEARLDAASDADAESPGPSVNVATRARVLAVSARAKHCPNDALSRATMRAMVCRAPVNVLLLLLLLLPQTKKQEIAIDSHSHWHSNWRPTIVVDAVPGDAQFPY